MSDRANPYAAPKADANRFWRVIDHEAIRGSEAESLRFAYARAESNIRALGLVYYLFGAWWSAGALYFLIFAYRAMTGVISAPWIAYPFYVVIIAVQVVLGAMAIATGYGLRGLRRWSRTAGLTLAWIYAAYWCLLWQRALWKADPRDAAFTFLFGTVFIIPMTMLMRRGSAAVLSAEYSAAIEQTPYIKIQGRLPTTITLAMGLVLVLSLGLALLLKRSDSLAPARDRGNSVGKGDRIR